MMMMPILFTFMFLWFPAGLVLYWVVNNSCRSPSNGRSTA
jgi:YidC/Oxa1 family membrane protein insertase